MKSFEQMVGILVTYEGKPLSPRKINIQPPKKQYFCFCCFSATGGLDNCCGSVILYPQIDKGIEMSAMKEYTLEIYKTDRRTKEGRRLVAKEDFAASTEDYIQTVAEAKRDFGFEVEVFETFVTTKNMMSGKEFQERYDTPYYCSPRSESYWSM